MTVRRKKGDSRHRSLKRTQPGGLDGCPLFSL